MAESWARAQVAEFKRYLCGEPRRTLPSFECKLAEQRRQRLLLKAAATEHPIWSVNDKDDARRWADELGFPRPALVAEAARPEALDFGAFPDQVVVKPCRGSTSRGVYVLRRTGRDWHDATKGRVMTSAEIVSALSQLLEARAICGPIIVEEAVVDAVTGRLPPTDWKFYAFHGEVGLVLAKQPKGDGSIASATFRLFDAGWNDLGSAIARLRIDPSISPPHHARALMELACRVSTAVARPFVRVDLYDGVAGPVFGEITPDPGIKTRYVQAVDEALGCAWERAEARLLSGLISAGAIAVERAPRLPARPPLRATA